MYFQEKLAASFVPISWAVFLIIRFPGVAQPYQFLLLKIKIKNTEQFNPIISQYNIKITVPTYV